MLTVTGTPYGSTTILAEIAARAQCDPDRLAFLAPGQSPLTYAGLAEQIREASGATGSP